MMKTVSAILMTLVLSVAASAQTAPVTTFKSTEDGFQISVPAANFKQVQTLSKKDADGNPFTVNSYAGDNPQGDYVVIVATYSSVITPESFTRLVANNPHADAVYLSRDGLDINGQPGVLRMMHTADGKMADWMTYKGNKFYQIIFGSDKAAEQLNFDEVNAFVDSFTFIQ